MRNFVLLSLVLIFLGCGGGADSKLIEALKGECDYYTVQVLLEKGASPMAKDKESGRTAIQLAELMIMKNKQRIENVRSGETEVMGGGADIIIQQMEGELEHNQMTLQLLKSHL